MAKDCEKAGRKHEKSLSRRQFVKHTLQAAAVAGFPTIVPASIFGQMAPSKQINVGAIGMGRISRVHDLPNIMKVDMKVDGARVIAAMGSGTRAVSERR